MHGSNVGVALAIMTGTGVLLGGAGAAEAQVPFSLDTAGTTSESLTFNQFDPSLGTLTGVEITLADSATAGSAFSSITGGEGTVTASLSGALDITAPGGATPFSETTSVFATCTVSIGNTCSNGPNAQNDPTFTPNPVTDTTDLAAFVGLGTVDLVANIDSVINGNTHLGSGTPTTTDNLTWSGDVSVTYQYTADSTGVPEPASLTLFGMGIGGLGFLRRQRKR
jgi:hypothetical protein